MALPFSSRVTDPVTLSAGQTGPLTAEWKLFAAADMQLVRLRADETSTEILDLGVDYSVSGVGDPNGFTVSLLAGAEEGDQFVVVGAREVSRVSTITSERGATPTLLNNDLDILFAQMQEASREAARSFKTSLFDPTAYDLGGRRLENIGNAVNPGDAVNLSSVQDTILAATETATATAVAAAGAATAAAGAAASAQGAAESAQSTAAGAAGAATSAANAATDALNDIQEIVAKFPEDLEGQAGKHLAVRDDETGYEFVEAGEGGGASSEALDALFLDQRITTLIVSDALNTAIFSGPDGSAIHDHFDALTYVDVGGATNLDTSEAGCLKASAAATTTLSAITFGANQTAFTAYNHRIRVAASQLSASGSAFRLTLTGVTSGTTAAISGMYAGHKASSGDAYDFDGTQVQVTVGGNAAFNVAAGATVVTDWITYAFDDTKDFVVAFHTSSGDLRSRVNTDATNFDWWTKTGATEVSTANVTGYTQSGSYDFALVSSIEVQSGLSNVSVHSQSVSAAEQPDTIRAIVLLHDAVGITLNTDILVDLSRNGGASWATATLIERYTQPGNVRVLDTGNVDVSGQPAGSSMRWRWRTANAVAAKNLGTAMWGAA